MAEELSIFKGIQLGVETTHGTGVAADTILPSLTLAPAIQFDATKYRPTGRMAPRNFLPHRDHVQATIGGALCYEQIVYLLASLINYAAPSLNTATSYTWAFELSDDSEDTVKSYTVEQGDATRAKEFPYGLVNELELTFGPREITLAGQMIGQEITDDISMTGAPTEISEVLVLPEQVSVKLADTAAGLAGASALERAFKARWKLGNRHGPIWTLNAAEDSWTAHAELEPAMEMALLLAADATGMGILSNMRAGSTKFMRIKAVGALIETGYSYTLQLDMAGQVSTVGEFSDQDGVYAMEWTFGQIYDQTWGKGFSGSVINSLSDV